MTPVVTSVAITREERFAARRFVPGMTVLVALAITIRIIYAIVWESGVALGGDPSYFQTVAANLVNGHGYALAVFGGTKIIPTALHPPVFPLVLAVLDVVGLRSPDAHRIALEVISAAAVVPMGVVGRRLMSPEVGLVAAGAAALSPLWIQWGGRVLSESVYLVVIPVVLWSAVVCLDRPNGWTFAATGAAVGLATLTRGEAVALVVVLGVPLVALGSHSWGRRARCGLAFLAGIGIILAPWIVRNEVQMGGFALSTDSGTTWVGSYTAATFSPGNPVYGSFDTPAQFAIAGFISKSKPPDGAKAWTELTLDNALGQSGMSFARTHLSELPGVVLAREGRLWGVYAIGSQLAYDTTEEGGAVRGFYVAAELLELVTIPLAIAGGILLGKRSRRHLVVIAAPLVVAALNAAVFYGSTRLRTIAEPSLLLLASIAVVAAWQQCSSAGRRRHHAVQLPEHGEALPGIEVRR